MCTSVCPPLLSLFEESEVSFEPAQPGHSGNGLKPNAHKHACYFLVCCAGACISAKVGQIRKTEAYRNRGHANEYATVLAC